MKRIIISLVFGLSWIICSSQIIRKTNSEIIIPGEHITVAYDTILCRPGYSVYTLRRSNLTGDVQREKRFWTYLELPKRLRMTSEMYRGTGYDRGHLAPAADMKYSSAAMHESFCMINIVPQHPDLNQKSWKSIEDRIRNLAWKYDSVKVYTGTYGEREILKGKLSVPSQCWKIIFSWSKGRIVYTRAWIVDNAPKAIQKSKEFSVEELPVFLNSIGRELKDPGKYYDLSIFRERIIRRIPPQSR